MNAALAAVGLIVAVRNFAVDHANPKAFALIKLSLRLATLNDLNREIFKPAIAHDVT